MSFVHIGQLARGASRRKAPDRRAAPPGSVPGSVRGRGPLGRWWFTASARHRAAVAGTAVTASLVAGILVSQAIAPFWWTNISENRLAAVSNTARQVSAPPVLGQQALWGLIAGPPGAIPALATSFTKAQPSVERANTAPATPGVAPAVAAPVHPHPAPARVKVVKPAVPVAAPAQSVAPTAASLLAAKVKLRALELSSQADSTIRRNIEGSGIAKLLCTNDPAAVAKWTLQSFCAALAASPGATTDIAFTPT